MKIPSYCLLLILLGLHRSLAVASPEDVDSKQSSDEDFLLDFDSLNSDHHIPSQPAQIVLEANDDSPIIQTLSQELADSEGKIDLGSQSSIVESELSISVSKDPTAFSGLYKFDPHGPNFFKDKVTNISASHEPLLSTSNTVLEHSIPTVSTPSTSSRATSIFSELTRSSITDHEVSPSTFPAPESTPLSLPSATNSVSQSLTKTSTFLPEPSNIVPSTNSFPTTLPEPAPRPEVQKPFQPSSQISGLPTQQSAENTLDNTLGQEKVNIEQTIKSSIEKFLEEKLQGHDYYAKPLPSKTTDEVTSSQFTSPVASSSVSERTKSTDTSTEFYTTTELPVVTKTVIVSEPTSSSTGTSISSTPSLLPESSSGEMNRVESSFPTSDSDIKSFIQENLGKDATDLNIEKLKSILNTLLSLQATGDEAGSAVTEQPEAAPNSDSVHEVEEQDTGLNLAESPKSELRDFENLDGEILESLGLKDTIDESRNTEHGSFLKKLKSIPQNVFDLVDERYGDEFREEHGEPTKVKKSQLDSSSGLKKKKKKNPQAKAHNKALEANIEKNASLNKVVKEKAKSLPTNNPIPQSKEKPKDSPKKVSNAEPKRTLKTPKPNLDLPLKYEPEDDYKDLNKGKITFGFDKKKNKIGLKKSKVEKDTDEESLDPASDEVQYYEPEKFLFGKASVDDDDFEEDLDPVDDLDDEIAKLKEEIARLTRKKANSTSSDNYMNTANSTAPVLDQIKGLLKDGKGAAKRNSTHSDPYSIPKVPLEQLKKSEISKDLEPSKAPSSKTSKEKAAPSDPLEKFKKNPSLLFAKERETDSSFDFTRSEANSIMLVSWSIMGAAVLVATSVILV